VSLVQLAYGKSDSFVVYLNFSRVVAKGIVDDAYQVAAMKSAWRLFDPLGLVHLTTVWPGIARAMTKGGSLRSLRPGEYFEVEAVEETSSFQGADNSPGLCLNAFDRNLDLWCGVKAYLSAVALNPVLWGVAAVHECGHGLLFNSVRGENGHTTEPKNVMYGGPGALSQGAAWDATQLSRVGPQLDLVRKQGLRWSMPEQKWVKVPDQGRPVWPLD